MPIETWLVKVKSAISHHPKLPLIKKPHYSIGVLAFETATLMSKLLHLWQSLSDKNIVRLRNESISLEGVLKIVSNDESFLLGLACAEMVENLRSAAKTVCRICKRSDDSNLHGFDQLLDEFADAGTDPHHWILNTKEMEALVRKMDRYVVVTATLHKEMDELCSLENCLKKHQANNNESSLSSSPSFKEQKIMDLQQKIAWQKQEVKSLKDKSLWNRSFDTVCAVLVRSVFTILARVKLVFGLGFNYPSWLPRSLSASSASAVHPTQHPSNFASGPLKTLKSEDARWTSDLSRDEKFFESSSELLKPPETTLGAAALSLHYANLIIVMEKMIKSPQLIGSDARDDLYSMLPNSIRSCLRARLKGVGFSASDPVLAGEWRDALGRILGWLSPLAHNMIKWQSERSYEQQNLRLQVKGNSVFLLQTLYFANKEKTEAAITELLVGLNYIWRFEREMTAKALFECANFTNNNKNSDNNISNISNVCLINSFHNNFS